MRCLRFSLALLAAVPSAAAASTVSLVFVGDVSFAGRPGEANPLAAFAELFEAADLAVANGEGLLGKASPRAYRERRLNIGARPHWAATYAAAGVDLVGTANNHTWDGGAAGLLENLEHLRGAGVQTFGSGATRDEATRPWLLERPEGCVAIVPATMKSNRRPKPGAAAAYYPAEAEDALLERISEHAARCAVVVFVHWGREGRHRPTPETVALAHRMVSAGARAVVGHHPHVLQGVERLESGAAIAYSLGNFVFTNRTPKKRWTGALELRIDLARGDLEVRLHPAMIRVPAFAPTPMSEAERERLVSRLARWSEPFGTRVERVEGGAALRFSR